MIAPEADANVTSVSVIVPTDARIMLIFAPSTSIFCNEPLNASTEP